MAFNWSYALNPVALGWQTGVHRLTIEAADRAGSVSQSIDWDVTYYSTSWTYGGGNRSVDNCTEVQAVVAVATETNVDALWAALSPADQYGFAAYPMLCDTTPDGQWVDPQGSPESWTTPPPGESGTRGAKSFFTKLALKAIAAAFRHGGDEVGYVIKKVDRNAASAAKSHSKQIADALDDIAKIPDVTANVAKDKLYRALVRDVGLPPGVALQIADGLKYAINILLF